MADTLTITEALAELKTIGKRLDKKQQFVLGYLVRPAVIRDPFEQEGGAAAKITAERQAIQDLQARIVTIRSSIQKANHATVVTIEGITMTIAEWLTWRKEVAPRIQTFLGQIRGQVASVRQQSATKGGKVVTEEPSGAGAATNMDIMIHVDESKLAVEIEKVETVLGTLDGVLSLKNATTFVTL